MTTLSHACPVVAFLTSFPAQKTGPRCVLSRFAVGGGESSQTRRPTSTRLGQPLL